MSQFIDPYKMRYQQDAIKTYQKELKHWLYQANQLGLKTLSEFIANTNALIDSLKEDATRLDKLEMLNIIHCRDLRTWIDEQDDPNQKAKS